MVKILFRLPRQHLPLSHGGLLVFPDGKGAGAGLCGVLGGHQPGGDWKPHVSPPARRKLKEMGVPFGHHRAVQMTRDYGAYDFLLAMDSANVKNMKAIAGGRPGGKIRRLLDGTPHPRDIADPWYTGNFDATYADLAEGCQALLDRLEKMSYLKNPSE